MPPPLLPEVSPPEQSYGARLTGVLAALAALAGTGMAAGILGDHLTGSDVTMLFLIVVVWAGLTFGHLAGGVAAVAGMLASNFFFFEPQGAFGFDTTRDAITLFVFILVAMTTSTLAAKLREEKERQRWHGELADRTAKALYTLFEVNQTLAKVMRREELVDLVEQDISRLLGQRVRMLEGEEIEIPPACHSVILKTPRKIWGALVFENAPQESEALDQNLLHEAVGEQVGLALERIALTEEMAETRLLADGERLRRALMNSISHDLRTPIGSIMGAASSLLSGEAEFNEQARRDQLTTIMQASRRLSRYVRNLLDTTVIEAGALQLNCDWVDLADTVSVALDAAEPVLQGRPVALKMDAGLPLLWLDAVLVERIFVNLFENAAKYSPPGGLIEVRASVAGQELTASVFNETELPQGLALERLFDSYYRGPSPDQQKGSGLGLSICRAFMHAHGGEISAQYDAQRQGLTIRLRFMMTEQAPCEETMDD